MVYFSHLRFLLSFEVLNFFIDIFLKYVCLYMHMYACVYIVLLVELAKHTFFTYKIFPHSKKKKKSHGSSKLNFITFGKSCK